MKFTRGKGVPPLIGVHPFGERLKRLREWQGLSHAALGKKAGLSPRYLKGLEAGTGTLHNLTVRKLAKALGVPVAELLEE